MIFRILGVKLDQTCDWMLGIGDTKYPYFDLFGMFSLFENPKLVERYSSPFWRKENFFIFKKEVDITSKCRSCFIHLDSILVSQIEMRGRLISLAIVSV